MNINTKLIRSLKSLVFSVEDLNRLRIFLRNALRSDAVTPSGDQDLYLT